MAEPGSEQGRSRLGIIGLVTLLGSAFIGFNTLLTSCASEDAATNAARQHAAEEDERFWTGAIQELSDLTRDKNKVDSNFESRCALLASRTAPFIAEVKAQNVDLTGQSELPKGALATDGDGLSAETRELAKRVQMLRDEFVRMISAVDITSPACKAEYEHALARTVTELAAEQRVELAPPPEFGSAAAQPPDPQVRDPLIALSPLSGKGFDFDLFWCEDGEDQSRLNFASAYKFGSALAEISKANQRIVGQTYQYEIGRVRVRRLAPELWQQNAEYSGVNTRNVLRFGKQEQGESELANLIAKQPFATGIDLEDSSGSTTPWYLSAYFCKANTSKAVAPSAATAAR